MTSFTGGAQIGWANATWPLAKLAVDRNDDSVSLVVDTAGCVAPSPFVSAFMLLNGAAALLGGP